MSITVIDGGFATTVQGKSRAMGRVYGIPPGGALDPFAHQAANELVGNPAEAGTLEIFSQGPILQFQKAALIAVTGAKAEVKLDDRSMPNWMSIFVRTGQILTIEPLSGGRTYLAVHGGFDVPLVLGSRSTYLRANLGGLGRCLQVDDQLRLGKTTLRNLPLAAGKLYPLDKRPAYGHEVRVRVKPGPHQDNFHPDTYYTLYQASYKLLPDSDRMGFRFEGVPLKHKNLASAEIAACGTVYGAMQVPANGQPIILMADHQVTGGYPIIGTILTADLPLVAQLVPGDIVRFSYG